MPLAPQTEYIAHRAPCTRHGLTSKGSPVGVGEGDPLAMGWAAHAMLLAIDPCSARTARKKLGCPPTVVIPATFARNFPPMVESERRPSPEAYIEGQDVD